MARISVVCRDFRLFKRKLHYFDLLWICCTTWCTTNPQQIELMEFELYAFLSFYRFVTATSELPAFLTSEGGLNSGFMMAHVTAAALGQTRQIVI